MKESHTRSFAKGVTWRVIASLTTMIIVYAVTGDVEIMAAAGAIDVLAKLTLYYFHERAWGVVRWGTVPVVEKIDA